MFDFLKEARNTNRLSDGPRLESLEERAVPAMVGGITYNDVTTQAQSQSLADHTTTTQTTTTQTTTPTPVATTTAGTAVATHNVNFANAPTNSSRTGTIPQFNPALGQLVSIEIVATGNIDTAARIENLSPNAATVEAELHGNVQFNVGGTIISATPEQSLTADVAAFDGQMNLEGASAKDFGVTRLSGNLQRTTLSNPADMAAFIGNSTVAVTSNSTVETCACGPGNLLAMIQSTTSGSVNVVYHYNPNETPDPPVPPTPVFDNWTLPSKYFLFGGSGGGTTW